MSGYVEGLGWPEKFYYLTWVVVSKSTRLICFLCGSFNLLSYNKKASSSVEWCQRDTPFLWSITLWRFSSALQPVVISLQMHLGFLSVPGPQ